MGFELSVNFQVPNLVKFNNIYFHSISIEIFMYSYSYKETKI